ncbi:MAG: FMN-binding protein [Gemmatimonadetes bacterium]|nr:FMN-binding protein [Gemmatimonadota bacterium]
MIKTENRIPILLGALLGILLLLAAGLLMLYNKRAMPVAGLPEVPSKQDIASRLEAFNAAWTDVKMQEIFVARPEPRSGVLVVYSIHNNEQKTFYLAAVRHDISCTTCRDLLLGVLLDPNTNKILGILPLSPWELETGNYDPTVFLSQFKGQILEASQWKTKDIDGISGATYSVQATLTQLRELNRWIQNSQQSPN